MAATAIKGRRTRQHLVVRGRQQMLFIMELLAQENDVVDGGDGLLNHLGSVVVGGTDISGFDGQKLAAFRRDRIGFVFQTVNLVPFRPLSSGKSSVRQFGGERITIPARATGRSLLTDLGLADRAEICPPNCPEATATGYVGALSRPPLVLVDEPTSSLDSENLVSGHGTADSKENQSRSGSGRGHTTIESSFLKTGRSDRGRQTHV